MIARSLRMRLAIKGLFALCRPTEGAGRAAFPAGGRLGRGSTGGPDPVLTEGQAQDLRVSESRAVLFCRSLADGLPAAI